MVEIIWTEPAKKDLKDIIEYFSQDSKYGEYFLFRILEKIEDIAIFPLIGRKVPEFDDPELRELIFQKYRIVYKFLEGEFKILLNHLNFYRLTFLGFLEKSP